MDPNSSHEGERKILEDLSKEDLIKKCKNLLVIAQKAKQAKDSVQAENNELRAKLTESDFSSENVTSEVIEKLTQQKLTYVTTIEDLKQQKKTLNNKLQKCNEDLLATEERNNVLDNENVSYKRQIRRLTEENEQLITHFESLEKKLEECTRLGLEQQNQLLTLEKGKQLLEDANIQLQKENINNPAGELQQALDISVEEVKKLKSENDNITEKVDGLRLTLAEKDKNIVIISEELQIKHKLADDLMAQIESLQNDKEGEILKQDNQLLKDQIQELSGCIKQKEDEISTLNIHVKELEAKGDKLLEKLKLYHSKIVKLAGNIKALKVKRSDILMIFRSYTDQVDEWRTELNEASQRLLQHVKNIANQNAELEKENQLLRENNEKFAKQLEAHKTDDEKSKALSEINYVKNDNERLSEEVERLLVLEQQYKNQIESLTVEKDANSNKLKDLTDKQQEELEACDAQNKKDSIEIQKKIEENDRICLEYRKIITKLEEDLNLHVRDVNELKLKNFSLQGELEHSKLTEKQFADKTSEEILKLVQENAELMEHVRKRQDNVKDAWSQTEVSTHNMQNQLEELVTSLKRENGELLTEMNEMNQALKERGETISKFQSHCEEVMKKLQIYESQANKNVDNISQKEEIIKCLQEEIEELKNKEKTNDCSSEALNEKHSEIVSLKNEIENLKERLNQNFDSSYAESETMSTSTISRSEEANRLKDLEGSWEEKYGKLRTLAVKLKGKIRDISIELLKEQTEKHEIQQKLGSTIKTISTLQAQCDKLEDELEITRKEAKNYSVNLNSLTADTSKDKQKLLENEELICTLKKEIEELNQEKANTEVWKKQISAKVQTFRKEQEANKVVKKELETKIAKLTSELEAKEQALKTESDCHKQTKNSLEHSNNERKKNSVLNLEMQDYERSVKELTQKLEKKQEDVNKLQSQLDSQKSTTGAIREQNKLLEERCEELSNTIDVAHSEVASYRKQVLELEEVVSSKENKVRHCTQLIETVRSENEELSTELTKVIAKHQKVQTGLKNEKELLRSQILGLQQTLRETQDTLKLKEDELAKIQDTYDSYKVRAQSVLRQNQNRDVGLEEKLLEEITSYKVKCETLTSKLSESRKEADELRKKNEGLSQAQSEVLKKYQEASGETNDLKSLYDQLLGKHQQAIIEHSETVRSLKVHAETLAQCYRQQLSEQEVRHNREIIELQSKIEKSPSPTELPLPPLSTMHREEGEGSESTENLNRTNMYPVPLERLLGADVDQEVAFIKNQLSEEESKVIHLTELLADTEQDLAKHVQMNTLLKEEIRRHQRSVEREKHAENLEYLKNVVFKFVTLHSGDERTRLVPVLNTILKLSPEETQKLNLVAQRDPGIRGWTNYLPLWSSSKPS